MNIHERRSLIAQRLIEEHNVSVVELAKEMGVSGMTVRRDLDKLERLGYARRVHGGAVHHSHRSLAPSVITRYTERVEQKRRIARAAVSLCRPGDSIAVDIGSTMMHLAEELRDTNDLRLIVITPSMSIGGELSDNGSYVVIVTGGVVRRGELTLTGDLALNAVRRFHVNKVFLAAAAISSRAGLTDYNMEDVPVKQMLIDSAEEVILLADSSKFESTELCAVSGFDKIDLLVTDAMPAQELRETLEKHGTRILIAGERPEHGDET